MGFTYDNVYYENYARLLLCSLCGFDRENLFCTDRPDIQSRDGSVGIEVTRDVYRNEAEFEHRVDEVLYVPYSEIPDKTKGWLMKKGVIEVKDNHISHAFLKKQITDNNPRNLIKCVLRKIEKLDNSGYAICNDYHLFVYVESMILEACESYILSVMDAMRREESLNYSMLYLEQWYVLYVCDIKAGIYRKISIPKELREKLREEALRLC